MPDGLRPCGNNGTHLAEIQALDGCIHDGAASDESQHAVHPGLRAVEVSRKQYRADIAEQQSPADLHLDVLVQDHRHDLGAAGGCPDVEYDAAGNGRQRHRKAQLQKSVIRQRLRHGKHLFAHTGIKAEHEGGVQCPTHGLYAQKDAAQHIQHRIGDPHKGADAQSRKAGGQNDGKTGGAAKYKVVGRTVKVQCYCIDDKSQIQQQKKACAAPQLCWGQVFAQAVLDRFHLSPDAPLHPSAG